MLIRWKRKAAQHTDSLHSQLTPSASTAHPRLRTTAPGTAGIRPPEFAITVSLRSDPGCVRAVNEDHGVYRQPDDQSLLMRKGMLALVADGMGGHAAGEIASKVAGEIISRVYYESDKPPQAALEAAFHAANQAIYRAARQQRKWHGMGTTCTALVIHEGAAYSAQVGDSRLYLVRHEQIYLMSEDHSAVMEMVRRGKMSLEDARHHEDKNIILRALGTQPEVSVATWKQAFPVCDGDHFVLCSDGLYDLVSDEEISQTVSHNSPHSACEQLIALARERGGYDNITAGIVKLSRADKADENASGELRVTRESAPVGP